MNSTSIPTFQLAGLRLATHREYTCTSRNGTLFYVPDFETLPCPSGQKGFIRRQCVFSEGSVHWTEDMVHCVSDDHSRYESITEWTYQIEGVNPRLAQAMVEETTQRISRLISYKLHGHLSELVVIGVEEKCSFIDLHTNDILYYSKTNCIQYTIHARTPSSYQLDLLSLVLTQEEVFCNALRQQFPNDLHACKNIDLKGSVQASSIEHWLYYPVLMGSVVVFVMVAMLVAYRKRIAAYLQRRRDRKQKLQKLNESLTDQLFLPQAPYQMNVCRNGYICTSPKGRAYCTNVVRFNEINV